MPAENKGRKDANRCRHLYRSCWVACSHLVMVVVCALIVSKALHDNPTENCGALWYLFFILDFPISVVWGSIEVAIINSYSPSPQIANVFLPAFGFGVFGTFQWFVLSYLLQRHLWRKRILEEKKRLP